MGTHRVWNGFRAILERFLLGSAKAQVRGGAGMAELPVVVGRRTCPFDTGSEHELSSPGSPAALGYELAEVG